MCLIHMSFISSMAFWSFKSNCGWQLTYLLLSQQFISVWIETLLETHTKRPHLEVDFALDLSKKDKTSSMLSYWEMSYLPKIFWGVHCEIFTGYIFTLSQSYNGIKEITEITRSNNLDSICQPTQMAVSRTATLLCPIR